ncbi:Nif11-like leader peptide family natural product precursor [Synechococcus sp. BIOS-E4-1]|uniref:Nif11-like leader peptide family natural product precursor n=1 Tax=Synechococcus sp. BIOS-E4-1 TaxID=1400864 RepID=UPI001647803A|nr:Nif11-like leader peptide family natural product precursor [Synechococcus sp. BIOS-E4-1]
MSEEQLKAFLEKVKADTSLQEKLKAASDADAVLAIAKEAGFSVSVDDLKEAGFKQSEISDGELEGAAGGGCLIALTVVTGWCSNGCC